MPLSTTVTPAVHRPAATAGGTDAPPVVLLHGFASSAETDFGATGLAAAIAAAGRTAIAVDLPGHGRNEPIADASAATTSSVVAAIAAAVADAAPEASVVDVLGYSLGARLAWELPDATGGRVRRLVLGGISPFEPFAAIDPAELDAVLGGAEASNPLTGMMAGMIQAPGLDTASLAKLIVGLASQPFDPAAGAPRVPALFLAGTEDPMSQGVEALVSAVDGARLERVPGDHHGALASPEFRAAALAFLS
ncbi:alpha/beta fold hydrolase [Agromyces larvae]|uniref:Alpha/beta hydrolase n=1 Tax=Agromyces larvae TaxID=2929802 RepID=A0ABY4C6P1_9MICO|nr:alpha/beta hydrolase [Agromyces larvae]UOE44380.1 alpha/beta hydrolase [Agromyces larvae]